jgi:hypothetical protein
MFDENLTTGEDFPIKIDKKFPVLNVKLLKTKAGVALKLKFMNFH